MSATPVQRRENLNLAEKSCIKKLGEIGFAGVKQTPNPFFPDAAGRRSGW